MPLTRAQFQEVCHLLDGELRVRSNAVSCDVLKGWKLHQIGNARISSRDATQFSMPPLRNGRVSVCFADIESASVTVDKAAAHAATFFQNAIAGQCAIPLVLKRDSEGRAAADAFAEPDRAGIGGWFYPPGVEPVPANAKWFSLLLCRDSLPTWFRTSESPDLSKCIAAFEALAQLVLFILRVQHLPQTNTDDPHATVPCVVTFSQGCDNIGVVYASVKHLAQSEPLCWILQASGFYCCKHGAQLELSHLAGVRNDLADVLSRGEAHNRAIWSSVRRENQLSVDLLSLLRLPWAQ